MLQFLYHSLMTANTTISFFIHLNVLLYLLTHFLPGRAARVPVMSSWRWGTVGHFSRPSLELTW